MLIQITKYLIESFDPYTKVLPKKNYISISFLFKESRQKGIYTNIKQHNCFYKSLCKMNGNNI